MSRARDLSKLGNPNVIKADTTSVGFGTQIAGNPANAASSLISAGIVTATAFYGDGSNLEGVASAGLGTAVDDTKDSIGQNIYYTNDELSIYENTTVNAPSTSDVAYTQYAQVTVESGKELIIADGDTFIPDVLGIGTGLQANAGGAGNGLFGTVYADNIENVAGRGGPNFPLGATVVGVLTATTGSFGGNVSIGGTLTYEDVTNVDSIGVVTARNGIKVTTGGIDVTAGGLDITAGGIKVTDGGIDAVGIITASTGFNAASNLILNTGGSERLRIGSAGQLGLAGANYGTSGQVLTSGGASAAPSWGDAGGGQWKALTTGSATSGNYGEVTTSLLTSSYVGYKLTFYTRLSSAGYIGLQQYHDGAYASDTNYDWAYIQANTNGNGGWTGGDGGGRNLVRMGYTTTMSEWQGEARIWRPNITTHAPIWYYWTQGVHSGGSANGQINIDRGVGNYTSSGGVKTPTGCRLYADATITYMWWTLYGLT